MAGMTGAGRLTILRGDDAEAAVVLVDDLGAEAVAAFEVVDEVVAFVEVEAAFVEVVDLAAAEVEIEVAYLEDAAAGLAAAGDALATGALYPAGWTGSSSVSLSVVDG
jgi:hypothetical protein